MVNEYSGRESGGRLRRDSPRNAPRLFLAPVAGYTTRAFRSLCAEMGSEAEFSELVSAESVARNPGCEATATLMRRGEGEQCFIIQLFGAKPDVFYRASSLLGQFQPDGLDLNAGCPVPKVTKTGAGAALMRDPNNLAACVAALVHASADFLLSIPVSVKIRSGWDSSSLNYRECAAAAIEAGASMVTLHARTKTQGYAGCADWSHIANLVEYSAARHPAVTVCASGDLFSPEDAMRVHAETGCGAAMFARGALGNPFIFREAREYAEKGAWTPPSREERIEAAFRELEMSAADIGEERACREARKTFCAYTKGHGGEAGIENGARLRAKIVHCATIADYRACVHAEMGVDV